MADHGRRDIPRLVAHAAKRDALNSQEPKQPAAIPGSNSPLIYRRKTSGNSRESGVLNPSSPSPGRGKRPQEIQARPPAEAAEAARPVQKKLKYDQQLIVVQEKLKYDQQLIVVQKKLKYDQELIVHVLLPNATSIRFTWDAAHIHSVEELLVQVQANAEEQVQDREGSPSRSVEWGPKVWLEDHTGKKVTTESLLASVSSARSGTLLLLLHDGEPNPCHMDKNMWNVTPKLEMLDTVPQGYTMQTALADQVDNALQAVWHNKKGDRRLVSVTLGRDQITIFDTGQGMDGSPETCIANWGTLGGSTHRAMHHKAVGGEPPFLKPYLGKYGAGGVAAALHLGRSVTVWSKTKVSKKVWSLVLELKALEAKREEDRQRIWRTTGACRDATKEEREMAPHGSFTRVEITKLKTQYCVAENKHQYWTVDQIRNLLKDVYFPYIQSDKEVGSSTKTVCSVEFEVNGVNLLEIRDCETAISNSHTCHGDPFVIDLHMKKGLDEWDRDKSNATQEVEANARITCQYFPNQKGKEALETVIDELTNLTHQKSLNFESYNRVTIRWLGRLLPEVKWLIFPFMEVSAKKEQKLGVRRLWSKRVRAFVDTDAGFHPNQSKIELEKDHPFVVALKHTGAEDFTKTSAFGVTVTIRHKGENLSSSQLTEAFMEWLKEMHSTFDEDFTFMDEAIYIFNHPNAMKELGVENSKQVIIFHKHMKDARGEYKVDNRNPLRIRLPKGTKGLKSEMFATVEFFFHDGAEDEHGEVKFLCRPLEVDEEDGCKVMRRGENPHFQLNKSLWFPAASLGTAKLLDAGTWKKKIEEILNKSPSYVEVLNEEDTKKLEMCQVFPVDKTKFEAGFTLPKEFGVVVRPKKGSGPTHKQGMIVAEPLNIVLTVMHCSCAGPCLRQRASGSLLRVSSNEEHGRLVSKLSAHSAISKSGVKGVYMFSIGSSEVNRLVTQGTYRFNISVESDKYKDVDPAISSIQILPSLVTSKWTLCNHLEDCTIADHSKVQPLAINIRLNERFEEDLFIQKYDEYDNRQTFENPMDLEAMVVTPRGESLDMVTKVHAHIVRASQGTYRLQIKSFLFRKGSLLRLQQSYEGLLRVCFINEQHAELSCKVLPGDLASIQVKDSRPLIPVGSMCFQEALLPGEIMKKLTLQGLDAFGNIVDKGQKMHVVLDGLEFQDNNVQAREVDHDGCVQLGGLLKVTCHYNSTGSITVNSSRGIKLCTISFKTITRHLVANQVPSKSYVGRQLEGICIQIVDENGNIDTAIDGYSHSITVDWLKGVTCPFTKGECILPGFKLPERPGCWKGKVYFSANKSLNVTVMVQLELATACSLGTARRKTEILSAECGVPFVVPFSVYDDRHQPALLTEPMKQRIRAKAEAKDSGDESRPTFRPCTVECRDVKMSRMTDIPGYEACIIVSGSVGTYTITLMDTGFQLKGQVESVFNLQHGHVARILLAQADGHHVRSLSKPLTVVEAKRCTPMPKLAVTLLDSEDNVCSSCEGRSLTMRIVDCVHWKELVARVSQGIGQFESSPLVIPAGSYQVSIELDSPSDELYSLEEQLEPIKSDFILKVNHGNYPSVLRLLCSTPVSVSLTGDAVQYLPPMSILVESADGTRLQRRPTVGVKLHGETAWDSKEYLGTFVEACETAVEPFVIQEDNVFPREALAGSLDPVRFIFTQVCAPSQAGTYVMEYFVRGSDVPHQSQHLFVKHGPPVRVEIIRREPGQGQEMDVLQVSVVDAHGNICDEIYGFELSLELGLSKNFTVASGLKPCAVLSTSVTVVKGGKADFGVFELSHGMSGMYTLKVFATNVNGYMNSQIPITAGEAQIFVSHGNISDTVQQHCTQTQSYAKDLKVCLETISAGVNMIKQNRAARWSLEADIRKLEEEVRLQQSNWNAVRDEQEAHHDEEIIQAELGQRVRLEQEIEEDIRWLAKKGNSVGLALLEAQSGTNFLSPRSADPAARDILGLVVMLARVESDALSRMLAEYMGVSTLLLVVCRTQQGASALEHYDANGNVDDSRGLHGLARARGYPILGRYEVLALMDIKPYQRERDGRHSVNLNHPQKILNIDKPVLPGGQVPDGFLGYAVNLLHLSSEHLQISVSTRHQQGVVGLRESLFFNILGKTQVYDTRQHMIAAKERIRGNFNGAISLDGGIIRKNQRQLQGRRSDRIAVCFSMVPVQERMTSSLLPPACDSFQRSRDISWITADLRNKQDALAAMRQKLAKDKIGLEHLERTVEITKTEQTRINEASRSLEKQLDDVSKARAAIEARSTNGTPGDNLNSQVRNRGQMRAFMM